MKSEHKGWKTQFLGKWKIDWMDQFTRKDIDMRVPAHITLEKGGHGNFQFILVCGEMDGRYMASADGGTCMFDFTWAGSDECDEASGDGWMKSISDAHAEGEIRFHGGDTYKFRAVKGTDKAGRKKKCAQAGKARSASSGGL